MLRKILDPGLSLILFAAAVWLLHNELRAYHLRDILRAFDAISGAHLWAAAGLTILSYAVMTGYDVLAMRYLPGAHHFGGNYAQIAETILGEMK